MRKKYLYIIIIFIIIFLFTGIVFYINIKNNDINVDYQNNIDSNIAENAYEITGSTAKDITFTITSAGTYTIDCVSTTTGRGGRIYAVSMSDTYSVASGSGDAGVMPLSLLKKEDEE